ncbi:hypothetical protein QJS04_geneDACA021134 [Acorus gramineus]|uniref:RNase H type-1 domain-containing protein n=1 Tax=Acorus gramineus TaxID=55184 RepID=A0AAV9BPV7_ACOGR|nr:hypothetical protein QJS04_geneDACA021134 [Acorus gramineus]
MGFDSGNLQATSKPCGLSGCVRGILGGKIFGWHVLLPAAPLHGPPFSRLESGSSLRIKESIKLRTLNKVFHSALSPYISKIVDAFGVQTTVKKKSTSIVTWLHPVDGWLKLNTDGSLADDPGGYGALIRNSNGNAQRQTKWKSLITRRVVEERSNTPPGKNPIEQFSPWHIHH